MRITVLPFFHVLVFGECDEKQNCCIYFCLIYSFCDYRVQIPIRPDVVVCSCVRNVTETIVVWHSGAIIKRFWRFIYTSRVTSNREIHSFFFSLFMTENSIQRKEWNRPKRFRNKVLLNCIFTNGAYWQRSYSFVFGNLSIHNNPLVPCTYFLMLFNCHEF